MLEGFAIVAVGPANLYTPASPPNVLNSGPLRRGLGSGLFKPAIIRSDYSGSPISRFSVLALDLIVLAGGAAADAPQRGTVIFIGVNTATGRAVRQEVAYGPRDGVPLEKEAMQRFELSGFTDITRLECQLSGSSLPLSASTVATSLDNISLIIKLIS